MAKIGHKNPYHKRYRPVHGHMVILHPNYSTWCAMKDRCLNPDSPHFADYGGRGITVCERWDLSFEAFALDMGIRPSIHHSIDRMNNDMGYSPENCRWATRSEQMLNRRKFRNNTSGLTGIVEKDGRFIARYDYEGIRYGLGRFGSLSEAEQYRNEFITLFHTDRDAAMKMTERRARYDSTTGIKGITKNKDGYVVRKTVEGVRRYLGFSKTFEGALEIWNAHK